MTANTATTASPTTIELGMPKIEGFKRSRNASASSGDAIGVIDVGPTGLEVVDMVEAQRSQEYVSNEVHRRHDALSTKGGIRRRGGGDGGGGVGAELGLGEPRKELNRWAA